MSISAIDLLSPGQRAISASLLPARPLPPVMKILMEYRPYHFSRQGVALNTESFTSGPYQSGFCRYHSTVV